jgi:hypothetical protein
VVAVGWRWLTEGYRWWRWVGGGLLVVAVGWRWVVNGAPVGILNPTQGWVRKLRIDRPVARQTPRYTLTIIRFLAAILKVQI